MLLMHSSRMIKHGTKVALSRAGHRSEMRQLRPRPDAPSVPKREVSRIRYMAMAVACTGQEDHLETSHKHVFTVMLI